MPKLSRNEYTPSERKRYDDVYRLLSKIIYSTEPDASKFSGILKKELAEGMPADWPDAAGDTLLHLAADQSQAVRAGLPQILMAAGADISVMDYKGETPLGAACERYTSNGRPEYLSIINTLLEAGAKPKLDERWKENWASDVCIERRDWLDAYIKTWQARGRRRPSTTPCRRREELKDA